MSHQTTRFCLHPANSPQHRLHSKRTSTHLATAALAALLFLGALSSCSAVASLEKPQTYVYNPDNLSEHVLYEPLNYADEAQWVARPSETPLPVDVIYLYPTSWQKQSDEESNICSIDNKTLRATAPIIFEQQATAFETVGNIFAPYYRQADASFCLSLPEVEQQNCSAEHLLPTSQPHSITTSRIATKAVPLFSRDIPKARKSSIMYFKATS